MYVSAKTMQLKKTNYKMTAIIFFKNKNKLATM
jgi:hypothetical protein